MCIIFSVPHYFIRFTKEKGGCVILCYHIFFNSPLTFIAMTASICALLLILLLPAAEALNGNGRQSFSTYNGWKAFEVVTQGDSLNGYKVPGQMDGIGVS